MGQAELQAVFGDSHLHAHMYFELETNPAMKTWSSRKQAKTSPCNEPVSPGILQGAPGVQT